MLRHMAGATMVVPLQRTRQNVRVMENTEWAIDGKKGREIDRTSGDDSPELDEPEKRIRSPVETHVGGTGFLLGGRHDDDGG